MNLIYLCFIGRFLPHGIAKKLRGDSQSYRKTGDLPLCSHEIIIIFQLLELSGKKVMGFSGDLVLTECLSSGNLTRMFKMLILGSTLYGISRADTWMTWTK